MPSFPNSSQRIEKSPSAFGREAEIAGESAAVLQPARDDEGIFFQKCCRNRNGALMPRPTVAEQQGQNDFIDAACN